MAVWMVRSGERGRHEAYALNNGRISVNFNLMQSLTEFVGQDDLRERLYGLPNYYPTRRKAGRAASQLLQFAYDLRNDDIVVMPFYGTANVAVGVVRSNYTFRPDLSDAREGDPGPHIREVDWLVEYVPRVRFDRSVQDSLENHKRFTVARIGGEDDANRIQQVAIDLVNQR